MSVSSSDIDVDSTSYVASDAQLGEGVIVGPFCYVGSGVILGDNVELLNHVSLRGDTEIGSNARIFPFASVGSEPQDLKYSGEPVRLKIGESCIIREGVTINPGTSGGGGETVIGDRCVLLANSHIAHDCVLGDDVILSNAAMAAGHCRIGSSVIFGGGAAIHQFCRVGRHAFIGGMSAVEGDVLPFGLVMGNRAHLAGVNIVGMKRAGFSRDDIHAVRNLYKDLFGSDRPIQEVAGVLSSGNNNNNNKNSDIVMEILDFVLSGTDRSLCVPDDS